MDIKANLKLPCRFLHSKPSCLTSTFRKKRRTSMQNKRKQVDCTIKLFCFLLSSFAYGIHTGLSTAGASSSRSVRNCLSLDVTRHNLHRRMLHMELTVVFDLSQTVSLITAAENPGSAGRSRSSQPVRRRIFPKDTTNARQQRHASHSGSDDAEGNMTVASTNRHRHRISIIVLNIMLLKSHPKDGSHIIRPQIWLSYN
ncbi:hypothetical protein ACP4OV_029437 [Aristida adscensionis]